MSDRDVDFVHEAFVLWPAWTVLVQYVSRTDPRHADPQSVYGSLMAVEHDRLAALLYAHTGTDTLGEATGLLDDLLLMAESGVRPRYGLELGLGRVGEPAADIPVPAPAPVVWSSRRRELVVQALAGLAGGLVVAFLMSGRRWS